MQDWAEFVQALGQEATIVSTGRPVIIKDPKTPLVMLTLAEFKHYRWLMSQQNYISAAKAHKAANRAVLQDLVGCPLGAGHPEWVEEPAPHWEVPFHYSGDGTLVTTIEVDAQTGQAWLTEAERDELMGRFERMVRRKHRKRGKRLAG
ncbi:MAG: hypothetical protein BroJett011_42260 [Chloroflexota bacterium]|nr:MAG: hypothetical protein BroJett011_42260 [Chloroflexota bacterium]